MANQYTIYVKNSSSIPKTFLLFNEFPDATNVDNGKAWSNVYLKSGDIKPNSGYAEFIVPLDSFAVCGNVELRDGAVVEAVDQAQVTLDKSSVPIQSSGNAPVFGDVVNSNPSGGDYAQGGYVMQSGDWYLAEHKTYFCGYGRIDPKDTSPVTKVVPVATWQCQPNQIYKVFPKVIFYVATGHYVQGQAVNFADIGSKITVDFSGRSETVATLTFQDNMTFLTPSYSS